MAPKYLSHLNPYGNNGHYGKIDLRIILGLVRGNIILMGMGLLSMLTPSSGGAPRRGNVARGVQASGLRKNGPDLGYVSNLLGISLRFWGDRMGI